MPSAERYARYRADQTTVWVSKKAAAFLARERLTAQEGTAAVLDRLLVELRRLRRDAPEGEDAGRDGADRPAAKRGAAKPAGAKRAAAKRPAAKRGAAKGGAAKRARRTA
jgi:hypothetical protein